MQADSRGCEPQTLLQGKHHDLVPLPPPPFCPGSLCCPTHGLPQQQGSAWCVRPFLIASEAGAAGSRAAAALLVAFSAQPVGSLAQGRDNMEEGYRALPPSFSLQGWVRQPAHLVSVGHPFVSLLQHVDVESYAWPGPVAVVEPIVVPEC